jgi:hypothetical protein
VSKLFLTLAALGLLAALVATPARSQDDPPISATRSAELFLPLVVGGVHNDDIVIVTPTPTSTPPPPATATPYPTIHPTLIYVTPTRMP